MIVPSYVLLLYERRVGGKKQEVVDEILLQRSEPAEIRRNAYVRQSLLHSAIYRIAIVEYVSVSKLACTDLDI